jgi:hypothetical protein
MKNMLVSADKACNNIVFVCKTHYYQCIINKLGINSEIGNRTYTPTTFSKDEILQNLASILNTLDIPGHVDDYELPYFYWIPKLHKTPYKDTLLVPKMLYKTSVNTPYKNINCCGGEAMLCRCVCQRWGWSNVDSQKFKRTTGKLRITKIFSNLQHQNL